MKGFSLPQIAWALILACALPASDCWADPVSAVQLLRVSGCGGMAPASLPLQRSGLLDRAAGLWAGGGSPGAAAAASGYRAQLAVGLRLRGPDDSILQSMRGTRCQALRQPALRDLGVFHQGAETWLVLASPERAGRETSASAARVLQLVNEVRAAGSRCGAQSYGPAAPLQASRTLDGIAARHAMDMASHDYFEHVDLHGNTPADRVRAAGYREKLVGENIAYGPTSAEEVVEGWMHSTGHCENIMDPRFIEMGLAAARGEGSRHGLYWDQVLAEPLR